MKRILLLLFMLLYAAFARAQAGNTLTLTGSGAPTGTCAFLQFWVTTAGALYDCAGTSWNAVTGGGGNPAFSAITSGTNTGAAMVIGTGASLTVSGSGTNNATSLGGATFAAPGPIGSTTPSTGAFSTLSASSTVSGSGFSTYLASPPAIGGSAAAAGTFTTLTATTYSGGAFSGTFTGSPTFSGNIAFTGTPTFSNALALGSSTASTQTACDNSTKLATTAYAGAVCETIETSGSPLSASAQSQQLWNNTASAYVVDLPTPTTSGPAICLGDYKARSSAISFVPGSGVTIYYKGIAGTAGSSTGLVSGGAAGDYICVVGTDTTTYMAIGAGQGSFTNN